MGLFQPDNNLGARRVSDEVLDIRDKTWGFVMVKNLLNLIQIVNVGDGKSILEELSSL